MNTDFLILLSFLIDCFHFRFNLINVADIGSLPAKVQYYSTSGR